MKTIGSRKAEKINRVSYEATVCTITTLRQFEQFTPAVECGPTINYFGLSNYRVLSPLGCHKFDSTFALTESYQ